MPALVMPQAISVKPLRLFLNVLLVNTQQHTQILLSVKAYSPLALNAHTAVKMDGSSLLKLMLPNTQTAMYLQISTEINSIILLTMKVNIFPLMAKNLKLKKEHFLKPITHTWFHMVNLIATSMKTENLQLLRIITMLRHILGQPTMSISPMKPVTQIL